MTGRWNTDRNTYLFLFDIISKSIHQYISHVLIASDYRNLMKKIDKIDKKNYLS